MGHTNQGHPKPFLWQTIAIALLVSALVVCAARSSLASTSVASEPDAREPLDLHVTQGYVSGSFESQPLCEILHELQSQAGFEVKCDKRLSDYRVSGTYDDEPLLEVLGLILRPFNHTIDLEAEGKIQTLTVLGPQGNPDEPLLENTPTPTVGNFKEVIAKVSKEKEGTGQRLVGSGTTDYPFDPSLERPHKYEPPELLDYEPTGSLSFPGTDIEDMTESERLEFYTEDDIANNFLPWQEPGTEETGPPVPPDMVVEILPQFDRSWQELGTEQTGPPVPPDMIVEDLPEFEFEGLN